MVAQLSASSIASPTCCPLPCTGVCWDSRASPMPTACGTTRFCGPCCGRTHRIAAVTCSRPSPRCTASWLARCARARGRRATTPRLRTPSRTPCTFRATPLRHGPCPRLRCAGARHALDTPSPGTHSACSASWRTTRQLITLRGSPPTPRRSPHAATGGLAFSPRVSWGSRAQWHSRTPLHASGAAGRRRIGRRRWLVR